MFSFLGFPEPYDAKTRREAAAASSSARPTNAQQSAPVSPQPVANSTIASQPSVSAEGLASPFSSVASPRAIKQFGLFVGGAAFFGLTLTTTRRAIARKLHTAPPKLFTPSNHTPEKVHGSLEAVEALSLATLNVSSLAIMITGGTLWALDVSTVDELRHRLRGALDVDGPYRPKTEEESDKEIEEWLATVLSQKDQKDIMKALTSINGLVEAAKQGASKDEPEGGKK
ncbi:hypothetical protein H2203_009177 [Taxawa tesnikishii (nom. ined.)]|nr:hypothetical protein H2203_009177 [Dothideales sp. JES 119]